MHSLPVLVALPLPSVFNSAENIGHAHAPITPNFPSNSNREIVGEYV